MHTQPNYTHHTLLKLYFLGVKLLWQLSLCQIVKSTLIQRNKVHRPASILLHFHLPIHKPWTPVHVRREVNVQMFPLFHSYTKQNKPSLLINHVLHLGWRLTVYSFSDVPLPFHFPKPGKCEVELSTSITPDIIRSEGYLARSAVATLILVKVIGRARESESLGEPLTPCFAIRIYLGWSRLHLWPRLHARGEGGRADLVVEIFSADSSACITHPPKDSTALLEWVSWLVHNAYLIDISTLKSANVHAVMWEELNTDTMDTTIHHFYLMSYIH